MNKKISQKIPKLITLKEASFMLRCHENTLRAWDKKSILKAVRIGVRGDRKYREEDIINFIGKNQKND